MSKSDLKAAMESLQVKKPLRLPASALVFTAPSPVSQGVSASPDTNSSKDTPISQDEISSEAVTKNLSHSAGEALLTQEQNASQVENQSQDVPASEDTTKSQDIDSSYLVPVTSVARASQPRRATEQDRAVTEAVSVKSKLSTGYTRVPNSILMEMVSGDLSRNEMKILLLVARMTISFNRARVPMSKGVIGRMTGIQGRSVLDALQTLQVAGLIEKLPGDCNSPNRLGLIFEPLPPANATQVQKIPKDVIGTTDATNTQRWDENSTYKKDNSETIDLRKKISLSSLSENLRKYFSELKPRRKRETEFEAFEELREDYSEEQIENCLLLVRERGLPISGAVCHSPMAYLAKAIGQVLPDVKARRERALLEEIKARVQVDQERRLLEQDLRDAADLVARENAFEVAFPLEEDRERVVAQYSKQFSILGKGGTVLRNLAVGAWWEQHKKK